MAKAKLSNSDSSFLRDAFNSYAQYTVAPKQEAQKRALKWLQSRIEFELSDQTILEQFSQKWRTGNMQPSDAAKSPLYLENLPGSYKGSQSIDSSHEDALKFLQEQVPKQMQDDFKERWDAKTSLKVSQASGTPFKIDEREQAVLQKEDANGEGKTWYQVDKGQTYYLLSCEEKGDYYLVVLSEDIGSENRNTWFVAKADVTISNI